MKTVELETVHEKDGSNISSAEKVKFDPFITPGVSGTGEWRPAAETSLEV